MDERKREQEFTRAFFDIDSVEVRDSNGKKTITGYAARFEKLSVPLYGFREKIRAGAFAGSLGGARDIKSLWNHNTDYVLGSTKAGTLRLSEDDKGLRFELDPPDTQAGRDAVVSIGRGDATGMSFGFRTIKQEWDEKDPKNVVRTLIEVDLREVSPTPFPAYPDTKVKVRTIEDDYTDYRNELDRQSGELNANESLLRRHKLSLLEKEC